MDKDVWDMAHMYSMVAVSSHENALQAGQDPNINLGHGSERLSRVAQKAGGKPGTLRMHLWRAALSLRSYHVRAPFVSISSIPLKVPHQGTLSAF